MTSLSISCSDLIAKAKGLGIYDLSEFYDSQVFEQNGFRLDVENSVIQKAF